MRLIQGSGTLHAQCFTCLKGVVTSNCQLMSSKPELGTSFYLRPGLLHEYGFYFTATLYKVSAYFWQNGVYSLNSLVIMVYIDKIFRYWRTKKRMKSSPLILWDVILHSIFKVEIRKERMQSFRLSPSTSIILSHLTMKVSEARMGWNCLSTGEKGIKCIVKTYLTYVSSEKFPPGIKTQKIGIR